MQPYFTGVESKLYNILPLKCKILAELRALSVARIIEKIAGYVERHANQAAYLLAVKIYLLEYAGCIRVRSGRIQRPQYAHSSGASNARQIAGATQAETVCEPGKGECFDFVFRNA